MLSEGGVAGRYSGGVVGWGWTVMLSVGGVAGRYR